MKPTIRLALYEPEIPQNTAAVMRTCACLGAPLEIIEPCGFSLDDRRARRVVMDYLEQVTITRHNDWAAFTAAYSGARRILLTTRSTQAYTDFTFEAGDILLFGRESAGVPETVHEAAAARLTIPMNPATRSLNLAVSTAMVLGEALRQLGAFPEGSK